DCALEMILQPEPGSRLVTRMTLAPFARHWSACDTCFCASPSAFTTVAAMPAFLKAAMKVGRSWVSQRTDDFVSGSTTRAGLRAVRGVLLATAAVTATLTAASAMTDVMTILLTMVLLLEKCAVNTAPEAYNPRWRRSTTLRKGSCATCAQRGPAPP